MTDKYTTMGKIELRAACKEAGISYSKLNNDGMREALRGFDSAVDSMTATECLDADIADARKPMQLSDEDKRQITHEAEVRAVAPHIADDDDQDEELSEEALALLAGEDDFEAGVAEERAERARIAAEQEATRVAAEAAIETTHPMLSSKARAEALERNEHVGPAVTTPKASRATGSGVQIEKNRDTQNGISRPSAGGKCRAVWDMLDAIGTAATAKQAREGAVTRGFDKTTTMVQFYRWRKFQGIAGRR